MNKKVICEKCGCEMISIDEKLPVGKTCPSCGWGWATTFIPPIYNDAQIYTVTLNSVDVVTKEAIQIIAEITGQNYLQTKKILGNLPQTVFSGKAPQVVDILRNLNSKQIFEVEVYPCFPYDIATIP